MKKIYFKISLLICFLSVFNFSCSTTEEDIDGYYESGSLDKIEQFIINENMGNPNSELVNYSIDILVRNKSDKGLEYLEELYFELDHNSYLRRKIYQSFKEHDYLIKNWKEVYKLYIDGLAYNIGQNNDIKFFKKLYPYLLRNYTDNEMLKYKSELLFDEIIVYHGGDSLFTNWIAEAKLETECIIIKRDIEELPKEIDKLKIYEKNLIKKMKSNQEYLESQIKKTQESIKKYSQMRWVDIVFPMDITQNKGARIYGWPDDLNSSAYSLQINNKPGVLISVTSSGAGYHGQRGGTFENPYQRLLAYKIKYSEIREYIQVRNWIQNNIWAGISTEEYNAYKESKEKIKNLKFDLKLKMIDDKKTVKTLKAENIKKIKLLEKEIKQLENKLTLICNN